MALMNIPHPKGGVSVNPFRNLHRVQMAGPRSRIRVHGLHLLKASPERMENPSAAFRRLDIQRLPTQTTSRPSRMPTAPKTMSAGRGLSRLTNNCSTIWSRNMVASPAVSDLGNGLFAANCAPPSSG